MSLQLLFIIAVATVVVLLIMTATSARRPTRGGDGKACRQCGTGNPPIAQFCRHCGQRLA